jgi:hypothetical protein
MPAVLTAASTLTCSHDGAVTVVPGQDRLKVDGDPVLVKSDLDTIAVVGCQNLGGGRVPCTAVGLFSRGVADTLKVADQPVLLETLEVATNSTPKPGTITATDGRPKLVAA